MINHESSKNTYKNFSNIGNSPILYNIDKYVIEHTPKKIYEKSQTSSSHIYMVRKNENEQDKNDGS